MVLILALPVPLDPTTRRTTRSAPECATPSPAPTLALAPIRHDTAYQEMADADALYVLLSGTVALKSLVDTRSGRRVAAPAGFGLEALLYLVESKPPPGACEVRRAHVHSSRNPKPRGFIGRPSSG